MQQLLALFLGAMHLEGLDFSCVHKGRSAEVGGALLVGLYLMMPSPVSPPASLLTENLLKFVLIFGFVWKDMVVTVKRPGCEQGSQQKYLATKLFL